MCFTKSRLEIQNKTFLYCSLVYYLPNEPSNMKSKFLILLSIFSLQVVISQNYQTVEEVNDACATLGFSTNEDAEIAVDEMMDIIGLQKNFTIQACPNINNAIAKNIKNSSGNMVRYILYDNDFFNSMDAKAGNDWAAISILAHEIGHHLNGHALNNTGSNHEFELDADYFSGLILAKMGASLQEAQSAIQTLRYEKATSTHPAKIDRLNEIERGWTKGSNYINRINDAGTTEENETDIPEGMEPLVQEYYRKAKNGDASAQTNLAYSFQTGNGVVQNYSEALNWYLKATEQGEAKAQNNLGVMYGTGYGVEKDNYEAVKWYRMAAEQGYAPGQYNLGVKYGNGDGVEKDVYEEVKWYRKAAEQGFAEGQFNLGGMYDNGSGVEKDSSEAVKWYRKAAEQGNDKGQFNLGVMYMNGNGVEQDFYKAVKWYRRAAEQGFAEGQFNLGAMYDNGSGVEKDSSEAVKWYRKAAEQRLPEGQAMLGYMYQNGYGVTKNKSTAIDWYRKAAKQGQKYAQDTLTQLGEPW
jgi:TPR repeat protein